MTKQECLDEIHDLLVKIPQRNRRNIPYGSVIVLTREDLQKIINTIKNIN